MKTKSQVVEQWDQSNQEEVAKPTMYAYVVLAIVLSLNLLSQGQKQILNFANGVGDKEHDAKTEI